MDEEFKNDPELEQKIQELQTQLQNQNLNNNNNKNNNLAPNIQPNNNNNNNNNNMNAARDAKEAEYAYYKGLAMNKDLSDVAKLNIIQIVGCYSTFHNFFTHYHQNQLKIFIFMIRKGPK